MYIRFLALFISLSILNEKIFQHMIFIMAEILKVRLLGILKRSFENLNTSLVRPHFEYASTV